jgi:hypothetical protein
MKAFVKKYNFQTLISLYVLIGLSVCFSCTPVEEESDSKVLAEVYDRKLYAEDLEGLVPVGLSPDDSAMLVNSYIDNWMLDASIMHEASQNMPSDLDIDELVKDYKESLILHNYEKVLINEFLDSLVTVDELELYIKENEAKFKQKEPLLKVQFIKILTESEDIDVLIESWKEDTDPSLLLDYCNRYAHIHMLDTLTWRNFSSLEVHLPQSLKEKSVKQLPKDKIFEEEKFTYLLKILEIVPEGETAPFDYAAIQAKKVILHQRKVKLLGEKKKNIFQEAVRKNQVKTYNE